MQNRPGTLLIAAMAALIVILTPITTQAGPPLVCHSIETGEAESLPWAGGPFSTHPDYEVANVIDDTLGLLTPETPFITRMETLRRAAIYAGKDDGVALRLLAELEGRALDAVATGELDASVWFDAGYLAQIYKQYDVLPHDHKTLNGYAWVKRAAELQPRNAEIQFALALICVHPVRPEQDKHLAQAVKLADPDSLLAKNIETQFHASLQELRDRYARR